MNLRWLALTVAGVLLAVGGAVRAADPPKDPKADAPKADAPKADGLPVPRPVVIPVIPGEGQMRVDRYAVWQAYGVDRFGRFRPLVIQSPCGGGYYYANGAPFPWVDLYPQEFIRVRVGQ